MIVFKNLRFAIGFARLTRHNCRACEESDQQVTFSLLLFWDYQMAV